MVQSCPYNMSVDLLLSILKVSLESIALVQRCKDVISCSAIIRPFFHKNFTKDFYFTHSDDYFLRFSVSFGANYTMFPLSRVHSQTWNSFDFNSHGSLGTTPFSASFFRVYKYLQKRLLFPPLLTSEDSFSRLLFCYRQTNKDGSGRIKAWCVKTWKPMLSLDLKVLPSKYTAFPLFRSLQSHCSSRV